mmetsp:Transcript_83617/g.97805  ORF Transcript_83617/g.97805 Transcript_83617/m.97805 type:complete len:314 (-) Transcript_83617:27-968(-)
MNATAPTHITPDSAGTISLAVTIDASLSLVGGLFCLTSAILIKNSRNTLGRMVISLSTAIVLASIMTILLQNLQTTALLCQVFSFLYTFANTSVMVWSSCFAYALFSSYNHNELRYLKSQWKNYLSASLLLPTILAVVSVATGVFSTADGEGASVCMQRPVPNTFNLGNLLVFLMPSVFSVVFCICCYFTVIGTIIKTGSKLNAEMLFFPVIFAVCAAPMLARATLVQINGKLEVPFGLLLVMSCLMNSQGLLNAVVYGLSRKIRMGYKEQFCQKKKVIHNSLLKSIAYTNDDFSVISSVSESVYEDPKCSIA